MFVEHNLHWKLVVRARNNDSFAAVLTFRSRAVPADVLVQAVFVFDPAFAFVVVLVSHETAHAYAVAATTWTWLTFVVAHLLLPIANCDELVTWQEFENLVVSHVDEGLLVLEGVVTFVQRRPGEHRVVRQQERDV